MPRFKKRLYSTASLTLLVFSACLLLITQRAVTLLDSWSTIPDKLTALQLSVDRFPQQVVPLVTKPVLAEVDKQATGIRHDLMGAVKQSLTTADTRLGDTLNRVDAALAIAEGLHADFQPILLNVNRDLVDGRLAVERAIHPEDVAGAVRDTRFLMARAARATGHLEQAADDLRAAVPPAIATWQSIGNDAAGIAADVHVETTRIAMGKTFWERLKAWLHIL